MDKIKIKGSYNSSIVKLKDIAEKRTLKNTLGLVTETFTNSAENGIISQKDFFDRTITNDKNISGYYVVEPDDFVYNPRISTFAPVGPINRNKLGRTGVMSPLYLVFHTHDVEPEYLEWYFKSDAWHQFMRDNGNTGARSDRFSISDAEYFNMPIPFPPMHIQRTIAKTLSALETKITSEKIEVDKLEALKSSMLVKMFPKEGERVPEIRFDGFTDSWEQRKVGELLQTIPFKPFLKEPEQDGTFEVIQQGNEPVIGFANGTPCRDYKDTVIFGDHTLSLYKPKSPFFVATDGVRIVKGDLETDGSYLLSLLERYKPHSEGYKRYYSIFADVNCCFTYNIKEQKEIGAFFTQLDNLITLHRRKYEKMLDVKKAFLKKLIGGDN